MGRLRRRLLALLLTASGCADPPAPLPAGAGFDAGDLSRAAVTAGAAVDRDVAVAPDGSLVAFVSDGGDALGLWTAPLAGGDATMLTGGHDFLTAPSWSPDGSRLAYVSGREGPADLWIVPAAGGDPVRMTSGPGRVRDPQWSPDRSTVLYSSNFDGRIDLWTVPADGGGAPVRLTTSGNARNWARWSPDGREIAFVSTDGGTRHIRVAPAAGGEDRPLTVAPGTTRWSGRRTAPGSSSFRTVTAAPTSG